MTTLERSGRAGVAACALIACVAVGGDARADLRETVARLADAWRAVGAAVVVDRPRFLGDGSDDRRPVVVVLPELPEAECTTVALLGARGLGFHVRLQDSGDDDPQGQRVPSVAGVVVLERCGQSLPRRLVVASDSGRGAIETVVARSPKTLPSLRAVLPERSGGTQLPSFEPGPLPSLPLPDRRAEVAEARELRDGATAAARQSWLARADGSGSGSEILAAGCHRTRLFAVDPKSAGRSGRRVRLDLDAEMHDASDDRLLARDRTDAPDATLDACVAETTEVSVLFAGAPAGSPVLVSDVAWPLPEHLPTLWGSDARRRMAHVLLARHVVSLPADPVQLGQGGYGVTPVPLAILPGACYLAVVALAKEAARSLGLRIHVATFDASDDRGVDEDGTVVTFCAGARTRALAEVEARGAPVLGWGFALYRLQSGVWERPR